MAPIKALTSIVGLQGVGAGLSFAVVLALTAILGPENYGRYVWVVSIGSVLALMFEMGLPTTIIKRFAPLDLSTVIGPSQISNSLSLYAFGTVVTVVLALVLSPVLAGTDRPEIVWALPLAGALACLVLSGAVLRAGDQAVRSNVNQFLVRPILLLAGIAALAGLGSTDPRAYLLLYAISALAAALVFVMPLVRNSMRHWRGGGLIAPVGAHFQVSIARSISSQLPIFITGFFVAPELLAYLAIAIRLTAPIRFGLAAARSYFGTRINAKIRSEEFEAARKRYRNASLFSIAVAVPAMVLIVGLVLVLLRMETGPLSGFDDTGLLLRVLLFAALSHLAAAVFGPVQIVAILMHQETFVRNLNVAGLALFALGLFGAAWAGSVELSAIMMVLYSFGISAILAVRTRSAFRKSIEMGS
ncbi:oligosaccharide flippase family protein [Mameliella alba]|nr:oligosaccharide flippase family protein [Antarctobacter heliothermus]MBY6144520.1 oligosaccharide flippase family protein [Mameliella alba]MCA0956224.1 oligosaccharide flippase family protein [Mameliella alba]